MFQKVDVLYLGYAMREWETFTNNCFIYSSQIVRLRIMEYTVRISLQTVSHRLGINCKPNIYTQWICANQHV